MMPDVRRCSATECYYNRSSMCHAEAINVGSPCPRCDAYSSSAQHGGPSERGVVGACHESECRYNDELSCIAPGIEVGHHLEHADCVTYAPVGK